MAQSQTLDRGLEILEQVARHEQGLSLVELTQSLGVHRSIVYRLVSTLESRGFISRAANGRFFIGGGMIALTASSQPQLRALALPHLQKLAQVTQATAYLAIARGGECLALLCAEPEQLVLRVGYRVGSCHPLSIGAAGIAILAGRPAKPDDKKEVIAARRDGVAVTYGQLQPGAVGVSAPLLSSRQAQFALEASVGVVALTDLNIETATRNSLAHARALAAELQQ